MIDLRTITPDDVIDVYTRTGLKPVFGKFGDGVTCGCALTALTVDKIGSNLAADIFDTNSNYDVTEAICDSLGVCEDEVTSFILGFDKVPVDDNQHISEIYEIGLSCRRRIIDRFIKNIIKEEPTKEDSND